MTGLRALLGLAALTWLAGCSVQMAYDNLDRLARWSVNDYVRLDDAQRAYFDHQFRSLWDWHRREHLPAYAEFLDGLALHLAEGVDEGDMRRLVDRVIAWAGEIEDRALPVAAEVLASLSDQQVAELARALEESNRELEEPELDASLEVARARWRKEFAGRFTEFAGRLSPIQEAYLDEQSAQYRPELLLWTDYRRRWQRDLLALLAQRGDAAGLAAGLRQLAAHRELYFSRELTAVYEHNNRLTRTASVWLINTLSERQQVRFVSRLEELADDFRELAADWRARAPAGPPPCLVRC